MRKLFSTAIVFGLSAMLAGCPGGDGKTGKTGDAKTGKTGAAKTGDAKTGAAKTGDSGGTTTTSTGPIVDHVKEGQKYTFEQVVDNAQMTMTTTSVWTVKSKTDEEIVYDLESTAAMKFKAAGMPEQKPKTTKTPGQKYPLKAATTAKTDTKTEAPKPIKEETIEVDGVKFECKVYENNGTKTWISRTFPGMVKMEGKTMKQTLKSIE